MGFTPISGPTLTNYTPPNLTVQSGPTGLGGGIQTSAPAAAYVPAPPVTNTNNNTNNTGGSGTPSTFNAPGYIAGIQQEYGAQINAAPQNEAILQGQSNAAQNAVNTNTGAQEATYQTQANAQNATLQNAIGSQQNQQQLSLAELADQIRGQHSGLQAQLGAVGAGNSSAQGLGDVALAHEQNTNAANVDQQANANISGAQTQEAGVNAVLGANIKQLDLAKQNQINTITTNYAQLMQQLQVSLQTAQGEEKARLAEFGQNLTASAIQSLTAVNNSIQNNANALLTQGAQGATGLQNIPTAQAVNPIVTPQVSPFSPNSQPGNATASASVPTGGSLSALLNQNNQQG